MGTVRVMVIDDDETTLLLAKRRLVAKGHVVELRSETIGTTNAIRAFEPDVVLLDVSMPAIDGYQLAKLILGGRVKTKLVLFSVRDRDELAAQSVALGAVGYVHKDDAADLPDLLSALVPV